MDFEFRYIIQWLAAGSPTALDPSVKLFRKLNKALFHFEPLGLVAKEINGDLILTGNISYQTLNMFAFKRKKIVFETKKSLVTLKIKNWLSSNRKLETEFRSINYLSLDTAVAVFVLYLIFTDASKMQQFQKLVKKE